MKRVLPFILVFACILCLVGCGETDKYSVTVKDNYPIASNLEQAYHAGEKVTIQLPTVTEQYYRLFVNGKEQEQSDIDMEYTYFTFSMPSENVIIEIVEVDVNIPLAPSSRLTGFAEFLDGERFVTGLGQGAFLSQMEKYSHNGIKITGGIFHYDGAYGGGCAGGNGDDFRFSNDYTVTDDGKHATYSNKLYTKVPLDGLTLPYGITFEDTLTTVLNKLELCIDIDIQSGFVSDKGRPGTMTLLSDSISSLEFINCLLLPEASGKPLYNFEIQYKENDKAARNDGRPPDVTRYIIMSFTDDNHKLGSLEMAVIERYELR